MKITRWLIFVALLYAVFGAGCKKVESYEKPLTPVKVKAVEQQFVSSGGARYSANIQPNTQVDLAFKVGGYVQELMNVGGRTIQEGDWISKGALLARIRDADFAARVKQAAAQVAEAQAAQSQIKSQLAETQAAQDQLKRELDRAVRLLEKESLIKPDYEAAKAKFEMSQARIEAIKAQLAMTQAKADGAKAQLEEAESVRKDCELRAPISGLLLKRNVEIGSFVVPGAPVLIVADTASVKAVFGVPDVAAAGLKPGSELTVSTEAMRDDEFRGRLVRVAPAADPKTRVFDVEVAIANPRQRLKVGMVVSLQVTGARAPQPVTVAPLTALFQLQLKEKEGGYAVFVIAEQGGKQVARLRRVKIGETLGNLIAVTEGINVGDQVVVSGATLIGDGEQVRVIPEQ